MYSKQNYVVAMKLFVVLNEVQYKSLFGEK